VPEIVLVALNASYSHTNLAIRYLQQVTIESRLDSRIIEFTINDQVVRMADELIGLNPRVVGLSCYIWNSELILKVGERFKLACPQALVILGGPQVIDCDREWMEEHPWVDFVLVGEGEEAFRNWCYHYAKGDTNYEKVPGLWWRTSQGDIISNYVNKERGVLGLAYADNEDLANRLAYYETSRGCAYRCSYCLSSLDKRVHNRDLEIVFKDLKHLAHSGAKTVKLVDRTFNLQEKRARDIIDYWCSLPTECCLHGEMVADIISDDFLTYLASVPTGRLQFEIGIQSTNSRSLQAVNRKMDWQRVQEVIKKLVTADNIHIHLDLLVGLPYEDLLAFRQSFNDVYHLQPHHLQIGMLKILPGTQMKEQADAWAYQYASFSPYELVANPWLTAIEVVKLHHLAETVEKLHNHIKMVAAHELMLGLYPSAYDYWSELSELAWQSGLLQRAQKHDVWAFLPIALAQQHGDEVAAQVEEQIHWALLMKERRYHFMPPFTDSALADLDFNQYHELIVAKWPHLQGLSLKEIKRQVVIHRLPSLVTEPDTEGLTAFLYPQTGTPCQGFFSW